MKDGTNVGCKAGTPGCESKLGNMELVDNLGVKIEERDDSDTVD